jgi:hypothetical protein
MHDEKVLEFIFTESPHAELIKRSLELCYLRAIDKDNKLSHDMLNEIWKCCVEKHEAVSRASFNVLQDLAQYLSLLNIEFIFNKIKNLADEDYDELRVNFVKKFTIGSLIAL